MASDEIEGLIARTRAMVGNPERLAALRRLGLLDTPPDAAFDRFTRLAARLLGTPVALVCFVDADRQCFKSALGLSEPWATARQTPLSHSFCQYTLADGEPLIVEDARRHPLLQASPAVGELGVVAYLGLPLTTAEGHTLGTLSVIDHEPRGWTDAEVETLRDLAAAVTTELELRDALVKAQGRQARQAEQSAELRRREAEFRSLADNAPDIIARFDRELRYLYVNPAATPATGLSPDAFLGRTNRELGMAEPFVTAWETALRGVFATGAPLLREFDLPAPHERLHFETSMIPEPGADGTVETVLSVSRDRTARRHADEALRDSEARFARLFEANPVALAISRLDDGNVLALNASAARLYGYGLDEMVGHTTLELSIWREPAERAAVLRRVVAEGGLRDLETTFRTKSGRLVPVLISMERVTVNGQQCLITAAVDLTERKRLEEQLRQSQKMEAIGRLAGGIAHDFNNMLGVILGFSDLLLTQTDPNEPSHGWLKEIHDAGERAASLTQQLLAFSRKQVPESRRLNLNTVVTTLEPMLRRLIGEDVTLAIAPDPALPQVLADPSQMEQVLLNLVVNARDAMPRGGTLRIELGRTRLSRLPERAPALASPGDFTRLTVSDTGDGMDAATLERIFEPFFTTKTAGKGTGLGLATVYGIIQQSHGFIEVHSLPGEGSAFTIYLPSVREAAERQPSACARPVAGGTETILLVEDEPMVRGLAQTILEGQGYSVLAAASGTEALTRLRERLGQIDLLVTDVVMPGLSGRELAERCQVLQPSLKVLFTSGYTDDSVLRHGVEEQSATFLQKPFSPKALAAKVRELLDAR